jgi:spore maturation protein SpmA
MNRLWSSFFFIAFIACSYQAVFLGNYGVFNEVLTSLFSMAKVAIDICIGLLGLLVFWCGLMRVAEESGVMRRLSILLSPLFRVLMPEVPKGHPAIGSVTLNMMANILGLDNAATPVGITAMKDLQKLNPKPDTATNAQIVFLVINTSSVTLFPITIFLFRAQQGAANPTDVFLPILLATSASTIAGILAVAAVQRLPLWRFGFLIYMVPTFILLMSLIFWIAGQSAEQMNQFSAHAGSMSLLLVIFAFLFVASIKKVPVYDCFISGAKQGIKVTITIIPFLLAMLVAIAALRSSGALDVLLSGIRAVVSFFGGDVRFVDALPTALMKPFSGSGSRAMMVESMTTYGADSFTGRLASIFQGSTETTFYVLAVYFGSVGIRYGRHAIACGLIADFAGITAAILVAYHFYG